MRKPEAEGEGAIARKGVLNLWRSIERSDVNSIFPCRSALVEAMTVVTM
jgi:hypothetical protein